MAHFEYLDEVIASKSDDISIFINEAGRVNNHVRDKAKVVLEVRWVEIGEFIRNTTIEYRRLVLKELFGNEISSNVKKQSDVFDKSMLKNERNKFENKYVSRSEFRALIYHWVQTFYERNWEGEWSSARFVLFFFSHHQKANLVNDAIGIVAFLF